MVVQEWPWSQYKALCFGFLSSLPLLEHRSCVLDHAPASAELECVDVGMAHSILPASKVREGR